MPRPQATSYRLGDDTLGLIDRLRHQITDPLGRPVSAADVIRISVRRLAEAELNPGRERTFGEKKKSRKSG